jgi:chemotaxis protein CheD
MVTTAVKANRVIVHPGDHYVTREATTISTLLGSCVAVCLFEPVARVMGMNHFLLAHRRYARDLPVLASEAGRYGVHAMELLVNGLLQHGAERRRLQAKAFGGSNLLGRCTDGSDNFLCVGSVNMRFIREFLSADRIPLVASDLGGSEARQIHFVGSDYSVYLRRIPMAQSSSLAARERSLWQRSMEEHEQAATPAECW